MEESTKTQWNQAVQEEAKEFLSRCSREAYLYFTEKKEMTQAGFEICLEEMAAWDFPELYRAFSDRYPEQFERLNQKAEKIQEQSRRNALPENIRERMWNRILNRLRKEENNDHNE